MNNIIGKFFSLKIIILIILAVCLVLMIITFTGIVKNIRRSAITYGQLYYFPTYPVVDTSGKTPEEIALIKRGDYLVKVGDCIACHTNNAKESPAFAGGLAMPTPFGVIYTPNITPDKETGIGNWIDEQFIKAMHEGISPDGTYYYPAFPYPYFNIVTIDDLRAIKAYLASIPAVHLKNLDNDMVWPFNWRFLQWGWRMLFFTSYQQGPFKPNPKLSQEINRGAYFVEGLGHCAMCHTPSHYIITEQISLGAPIREYNLTGANIQGYLAPNITSSNLGAIPDSELMQVFTNYRLLGGGPVKGPMLEAVHDSLIHLTNEDLLAMIAYLKSVKSELPPQPTIRKSPVGSFVYNSYCSGCHAFGVGGAPKTGDKASWEPLVRSGIKGLYAAAIQGAGNMPPKGTCLTCSDLQIKQAVDYMVAITMEGPQANAASAQQTQLTMADGQKIYEQNCSVCHTAGINHAPKLGDQVAWQAITRAGFLNAYRNILTGQHGHPKRGGCTTCSDEELIAALKYIMQKGDPSKNYDLW